jgi:hypothetical protein
MKGIHSMKPNTIAPTTAELATIAATLAAAAPRNVTPETLAERALAVWRACEALQAASNQTVTEQCKAAVAVERARFPKPAGFPLSFAEFQRLAFPTSYRAAQREELFLDYLPDRLREQRAIRGEASADWKPTRPEIAAALREWESGGIGEGYYYQEASALRKWLAARTERLQRERGVKGAAARHG